MVEKVRQAARTTSNQAQQLLETKIKGIRTSLDETTAKLQRCRKLTNFVEKDLDEMRDTFARLQQTYNQITQASSMKLYTDGSEQLAWETLIYMANESTDTLAPREQRRTPFHESNLERTQRQSTTRSQKRSKLECDGCCCDQCGKCRDWKFDGERDTSDRIHENQTRNQEVARQVRRIRRAACTYSDFNYADCVDDDYLSRYSVHIYNHMCVCNRE